MNLTVISGGQTGADIAGLRAAKAAGIPTGGAMPKGYLTEVGPAPHLKDEYGLVELETSDYPSRTRWNMERADACIWFGDPHSRGGRLTLRLCERRGITTYIVGEFWNVQSVTDWLRIHLEHQGNEGVQLLVAGNRESSSPGIAAQTETFLREVFALLKGDA